MDKRLKVGTKWILGLTGGSRFRLTSFQDVNNRRPRHLKASKNFTQKIPALFTSPKPHRITPKTHILKNFQNIFTFLTIFGLLTSKFLHNEDD